VSSVPYVNVPASIDRAKRLEQSGRWHDNREVILGLLRERGRMGATWKELAYVTGLHHGQVSGMLSTLHQEGLVFAVRVQRDRCHPYVHTSLRDLFLEHERMDEPVRTKASLDRERLERCRLLVQQIIAGVDMNRLAQYAEPTLYEQLTELAEVLRDEH